MREREINPIGIERKRCLLIDCLGVDVPWLLLLLLSSCYGREKDAHRARYKVDKSQWEKILCVTAKLPYDSPYPTPVQRAITRISGTRVHNMSISRYAAG